MNLFDRAWRIQVGGVLVSQRDRDTRAGLDCAFKIIPDAQKLASALSLIPGVVEHGLFIRMASAAIIGTETGIQILEAGKTT